MHYRYCTGGSKTEYKSVDNELEIKGPVTEQQQF